MLRDEIKKAIEFIESGTGKRILNIRKNMTNGCGDMITIYYNEKVYYRIESSQALQQKQWLQDVESVIEHQRKVYGYSCYSIDWGKDELPEVFNKDEMC